MLEAYEAFGSWETMADMVEGMICHIAEKLFGGLEIKHSEGKTINLKRPWRRLSMAQLVEERTGWKFSFDASGRAKKLSEAPHEQFEGVRQCHMRLAMETHVALLRSVPGGGAMTQPQLEDASAAQVRQASAAFMDRLASLLPAEQLQEVYEKLVEPKLIDPTFVTNVPSVIIPLAKKNAANPFFADVYELAINGQEISPGYSELNDPDVQAENFAHQVGDKDEQQKVDTDFLTALKYGMPPAGGMGMGIDRLVMMLTGAQSIRDVILFPLMRPQG
jgi:lysyl-tRNA synthetase class 2